MRMSPRLRRAATVATPSAALVLGGVAASAPASAESVTVPGCWGVAVVYCNQTVEYVVAYAVSTTPSTVPVCAGTCTDVPVPMPKLTPGVSPHVCVTAQNRAGLTVLNECVPLTVTPPRPAYSICTSYDGTPGVEVWDRNTGETIVTTCYY